MKININNKIYVQKKDIELIIEHISEDKTPKNIVDVYKKDFKDFDFIEFKEKEDVDFINKFWFIIDYMDFKDFSECEIIQYRENDLKQLRQMQSNYDSKYMIDEKKIYSNFFEMILDKFAFYIPNINASKNYPLDFRLLYNKLLDFDTIYKYKSNQDSINLPKEINRPISYSKKQLQQIYNEVLNDELSFEELKPIQKPLYSIFSRMNYSPEILNTIRKLFYLNENSTLEFIQDELLDLLLKLVGKKTKFEEDAMFLIDHLYSIGYNNFNNFNSKIILEMDLKRIKETIGYIIYYKPDDSFIKELSNYNYYLAEIIKVLKESNFAYVDKTSIFINDIFLNMLVYVYFRPEQFSNNFDFMKDIYTYLNDDFANVIDYVGYEGVYKEHKNNFVKYFNNSNKLLLEIYNEKYKDKVKKINSPKK